MNNQKIFFVHMWVGDEPDHGERLVRRTVEYVKGFDAGEVEVEACDCNKNKWIVLNLTNTAISHRYLTQVSRTGFSHRYLVQVSHSGVSYR